MNLDHVNNSREPQPHTGCARSYFTNIRSALCLAITLASCASSECDLHYYLPMPSDDYYSALTKSRSTIDRDGSIIYTFHVSNVQIHNDVSVHLSDRTWHGKSDIFSDFEALKFTCQDWDGPKDDVFRRYPTSNPQTMGDVSCWREQMLISYNFYNHRCHAINGMLLLGFKYTRGNWLKYTQAGISPGSTPYTRIVK